MAVTEEINGNLSAQYDDASNTFKYKAGYPLPPTADDCYG
jgi:hypothetical protein